MSNTIGKLIEDLVEVFKKNYKRPKLWLCIGIIVFFFVLLFPYIDSNFLYFSRMEKRISILERVMELEQDRINSNHAYQREYQSILNEMEQQSERTINSVMNRVSNYINTLINIDKERGNLWIKFFSGSIWFFLITVFIPFMNTFKKRSDKVLAFILMLIISLVVGYVCSIIPIIITPLFNYIGIPVAQIVIVIAIACNGKKKS